MEEARIVTPTCDAMSTSGTTSGSCSISDADGDSHSCSSLVLGVRHAL